MSGAVQTGLLIALYYASAGALVLAAAHGIILARNSNHPRSAWFYGVLNLVFALFQICCALQYSAPDLAAAVEAHKWVNATSLCIFPLLLFILHFLHSESRPPTSFLLAGVLVAGLVATNFSMPYGIRFADVDRARLASFPWGERLLILGGQESRVIGMIRLLPLVLVALSVIEARKVLRQGEPLSSRLLWIGGALMLLTSTLAGLSDRGSLNLPYLGGFAYLGLVSFFALLVRRQIVDSQQAERRIHDRLLAEIGCHGETLAKLRHREDHDTLTALPNRAGMLDRLRQALEVRYPLTVLLIDIDQFEAINDEHGHEAGDRLLAMVASRLQDQIRDGGFVARSGDDEFVVAATELGAVATIGLLFQTAPKRASLPFEIGGQEVEVTFSLGVSTYPEDGGTVAELLTAADLAVRDAKRRGGGQICFFRRDLGEQRHERLMLGGALRNAIGKGQLHVVYQPQLGALDGRPAGVEALLRWSHPERGLIPPSLFIPIAEELNLIADLGGWVIEEACRTLAQWRKTGLAAIRMSVNISTQQLQQGDLAHLVGKALARFGLSGGDLELEITETALMSDAEDAIVQLDRLRALGVRLSVDDFGTGYSSLSYLSRLPVDALKLDRSFVGDIRTGSKGAAICAATIRLAHTLGIETVAEGVETEAQAIFLREQGCTLLQGYLFAEPLPPDAAIAFLRRMALRAEQGGASLTPVPSGI